MNKKIIPALVIAGTIALTVCAENKTMFVHHGGQIEPFFFSEIDSMRYSPVDIDSTLTSAPVVHEIWTPDSTYRYRLVEIDSITFQSPATVARPDAVNLAGLADYIVGEKTDDGLSLSLLSSTPAVLLPKAGECVYLEKPTEALPAGFAGRVKTVKPDAGAITLECEPVELYEIFTSLAWVGENYAEAAEPAENPVRRITTSGLVGNLTYPDLISGAYIMTDELRDIPAGPEQAKITGRVAVHPTVKCQMGTYIVKRLNGEPMNMRRMRTEVLARVEASAQGRAIAEKKSTVGFDEKVSLSLPMGYGQKAALTFKATMAVKGTVGVDYDFSGTYRSSAVSKVVYNDAWEMAMESEFKHIKKERLTHSLSTSMDGELSLNGSLSLTMTQSGDSLKSITHTYVYGSSLKGSALYLKSQIADAYDSNELYTRLTRKGIVAKPLESIVGTAKYSLHTIKNTAKLGKPDSVSFFAVPCLKISGYDAAKKTISYAVEGTPMKFASARLGVAVENTSGAKRRTATDLIWPNKCGSSAEIVTDYSPSDDVAIYPTVTLPSGESILAAPKYPRSANDVFPVAATLESKGIRFTVGAPIIGSGAANGVSIHVGNFLPFKTSDSTKKDK